MVPRFVHFAGSQPYRFDRVTADEIAWFSELHGPNQIASAPRSVTTSDLHRGTGNGHTEHGNGNGYGHDKHAETPEAGTAAMFMVALVCIGASRVMRWRAI
jgi:hypothetical protein